MQLLKAPLMPLLQSCPQLRQCGLVFTLPHVPFMNVGCSVEAVSLGPENSLWLVQLPESYPAVNSQQPATWEVNELPRSGGQGDTSQPPRQLVKRAVIQLKKKLNSKCQCFNIAQEFCLLTGCIHWTPGNSPGHLSSGSDLAICAAPSGVFTISTCGLHSSAGTFTASVWRWHHFSQCIGQN